MDTQAYLTQAETKSNATATVLKQKSSGKPTAQLLSNRPIATSAMHQAAVDSAPRIRQLQTRQAPLAGSFRVQQLKARPALLAAGSPMGICQRNARVMVAQRVADMTVPIAELLHRIRVHAEQVLWKDHNLTNTEIQVGLEDLPNQQRVVTIGWNVGGKLGVNSPPGVNEKAAQGLLQEQGIAGNGITKIKLIKTNTNKDSAAIVQERTIHAEGIIIAERLREILHQIIAEEEIRPITLSIFGKKIACKECNKTISSLASDTAVKRFFILQTADKNVFAAATQGEAGNAGGNAGAWINPLHLIKDTIIAAKQKVEKNGPSLKPDGQNYDKLMPFLDALLELANQQNPV